MERANGISEMDDDMTDSILDYHSELEKLGYKIINWEDGSGGISDSNGKDIVIWDQATSEYKWAGKPWTWSPFDWPDLEKEVYLKFKDKEKEKVTTMEEINETTIKSYATDNNFSGKKNIETVKELKAKLIKQGILQEEDDLYLITEAEAKKNRTKIKNEDNKITIYIPIENENSEKQEYRTETYYPIQDTNNYKKLIENKIKSKTKNKENKTVEYEEKEKVTTMEEINETTIKSYATNNNFSGKKNIETVKELKAKLIKQGILQEEDDLYLITEAEAKKNRTKIKNEDNKITIYIPIENENSEKQEYRTETYYPIQDTTNYKKLIENKIKSKTKNEENKTVEYSENKDNYTLKIPYSVTINNSELTPQEYTKDIFEMLKKINSIPEEDLKIGKKNKQYLETPLKAFENIDSENDEQMQKAFLDMARRNEGQIFWEILGHLYNKTKQNDFEGFRKKHTELGIIERNNNIEAIENNKHPLQEFNDKPMPYIVNGLNQNIYRGATQIQLQRNNLMNNTQDLSYMPIAGAIEAGGKLRPNYQEKAVLIANGVNNNGNHVYSLVLPSRDFIKQQKNQERKEKAARKLAAKHAIMDAKFYAKYGELPMVSLDLVEQKRTPIPNSEYINITAINPQNKDMKEIIQNSFDLLFKSMMTQESQKLPVDFKKEPYKSELIKFAKENPEEMLKITNNSYLNVAQQINSNSNSNSNENTNSESLQNTKKSGHNR